MCFSMLLTAGKSYCEVEKTQRFFQRPLGKLLALYTRFLLQGQELGSEKSVMVLGGKPSAMNFKSIIML